MIVGRSIFSDANHLVLAAGQRFDAGYIRRILELGYSHVYVEEEGFESIQPTDAISETVRTIAERAVFNGIEALTHAIQMKGKAETITKELLEENSQVFRIPNINDMSVAVASIVRDIIDHNVTLVDVFAELTESSYLYRHAVNVTVLSVLIARRFSYTSKQLRELGLGALMHDIGKTAIKAILDKPRYEFTDKEQALYEEHPVFGSILLRNTDPMMFTEYFTILHHHEWQNGRGFPQGLPGDNQPPTRTGENPNTSIFRYAEIVAVANEYDNLVNGYGDVPRPLDPADALGTIFSFTNKRFNQSVCHAFTQIVSLYPTGSMVQILESDIFELNGYYAVIKEQGVEPDKPSVILYADNEGKRVEPKTVDFRSANTLRMRLMG